jgi:hypothetical protein
MKMFIAHQILGVKISYTSNNSYDLLGLIDEYSRLKNRLNITKNKVKIEEMQVKLNFKLSQTRSI